MSKVSELADYNVQQLRKVYLFRCGNDDAMKLRDALALGLARQRKKVEVYVTGEGPYTYFMQVLVVPASARREYRPSDYPKNRVYLYDGFYNERVTSKRSTLYQSYVEIAEEDFGIKVD